MDRVLQKNPSLTEILWDVGTKGIENKKYALKKLNCTIIAWV